MEEKTGGEESDGEEEWADGEVGDGGRERNGGVG